MRLTESKIREVVRRVISESVFERDPAFPPGSRAALTQSLTVLAGRMKQEAEESQLPSVREYMELLDMQEQLPIGAPGDAMLTNAFMPAVEEMMNNPIPSLRTAVMLVIKLVWSKWLDGQGSDDVDAATLESGGMEESERFIMSEIMQFIFEPGGQDPIRISDWVGSLPMIWCDRVYRKRLEMGMSAKDAET